MNMCDVKEVASRNELTITLLFPLDLQSVTSFWLIGLKLKPKAKELEN